MTLRQCLISLMQRVHLIPEGLAEHHVQEMDDAEVYRRMRMYARLGAEFSDVKEFPGPVARVAHGAIGNLTIYGMGDRAGKPLGRAHAGSREFPRREPERGKRI